jgi:hypothetical protein
LGKQLKEKEFEEFEKITNFKAIFSFHGIALLAIIAFMTFALFVMVNIIIINFTNKHVENMSVNPYHKEVDTDTKKKETNQKLDMELDLRILFMKTEASQKDGSFDIRTSKLIKEIVKIVYMYEQHETDVGGSFPVNSRAHLVFSAMLFADESMGLMDLRGCALNKYKKSFIEEATMLKMTLSARWLAHQFKYCNPKDLYGYSNWRCALNLYKQTVSIEGAVDC